MIKLIIFDLDDTLYNEKNFVHAGFKEVCKYIAERHSKNHNLLYKDTIDILKNHGRGNIFNVLCEKYSIDENINDLIKIYRETKPELKLYEDAEKILNTINKDYKMGIITDGMAGVQWNKIESLNLKEKIEKIIVTDDYGRDNWKPSTKPFKMMLDYFKVKPEESVYIGDNPNKDFIPCKNLGMHSIRIVREEGDHMKTFMGEEYEADYNVKSLIEVRKLLKEVL